MIIAIISALLVVLVLAILYRMRLYMYYCLKRKFRRYQDVKYDGCPMYEQSYLFSRYLEPLDEDSDPYAENYDEALFNIMTGDYFLKPPSVWFPGPNKCGTDKICLSFAKSRTRKLLKAMVKLAKQYGEFNPALYYKPDRQTPEVVEITTNTSKTCSIKKHFSIDLRVTPKCVSRKTGGCTVALVPYVVFPPSKKPEKKGIYQRYQNTSLTKLKLVDRVPYSLDWRTSLFVECETVKVIVRARNLRFMTTIKVCYCNNSNVTEFGAIMPEMKFSTRFYETQRPEILPVIGYRFHFYLWQSNPVRYIW